MKPPDVISAMLLQPGRHLQAKSPDIAGCPGFSRFRVSDLPEEVVDHVHHFTGVEVHQQYVVKVADPSCPRISWGQAVLPGICNPVAARIERRSETQADRETAVAIA